MSLDSWSTQLSQGTSLFNSSTLLKQGASRRAFIKALLGLVILGGEGTLVACGSNSTVIPAVPSGIELFTYHGHTDWVFAAAWSPQSQYIASGGADTTVQIWNAVNGLRRSTHQHGALVSAIAWSPDGNYVTSAGDNGLVHVWDASGSTGKPVSTYNVGGHLWGLEWSLDGKFIALGVGSNQRCVKIYDTSNKRLKLICNNPTGVIWNVAWSPDGNYVAGACEDHTVRIFDIGAGGSNNFTFRSHKDVVWGVDWSPDGRYIASGGFDNKIFVWEARSGDIVFSGDHSDAVFGVSWSPDGTQVTSSSQDGFVKVWNVGKRSNVVSYDSISGPVYRSSWAPEGKRIATAYRDGTVQVWRLPT